MNHAIQTLEQKLEDIDNEISLLFDNNGNKTTIGDLTELRVNIHDALTVLKNSESFIEAWK